MRTSNTVLTWRVQTLILTPALKQAVLLAVLWGGLWWGFGLAVKHSGIMMLVWDDQAATFTTGYISQPYLSPGFINPPWAMLLLAPFSRLRFELAVLLQMLLYFVILTGIVFKFSPTIPSRTGNSATGLSRLLTRYSPPFLATLVLLTSPLALNTAMEINIDWIVCLGLLVPGAYSAPFLLIKPQNAMGYVFSLSRRDAVRWLTVALITLLLSFMLWGNWLTSLLNNLEIYSISPMVNAAPPSLLRAIFGTPAGIILSGVIGLLLLMVAVRRHDALAGVWGGLFFVPYLAGYSLMLPFALLAARYPRFAGLISMALWFLVVQAVLPLVGKL